MAEITRQIGISAVNTAVVTRLKTNANTLAYATKIFNNIMTGTTMPYIHVTGYLNRPSALFASRDFAPEDISFQVHVWSNYRGDKEAADIMNLISKALTATAISVTDYANLFKCSLEYADIMTDDSNPDAPVRHGVCRFMLRVCPS